MPSNQKQVDTHTFTEGINTVIADELIPANTARRIYNCNILSQGEGSIGIVTNVKGNNIISFTLPEEENTCIGTANDEENNKFYFFICNSLGYHSIFQFDALTKVIVNILENLEDTGNIDILNFNKDYLILHADVIKGKLYWVDGLNNARKTNISKLIDNSSTGYGGTIIQSFIDAYKQNDPFPPQAVYFSDVTKKFNRLYGSLFKFATRFIYDDGETSNWSDFSSVPLPTYEPFTGVNAIPTDNNGINITFGTGDKTVVKIEVAIQSTSGETNNISILNWEIIATINKARLGLTDNSQYTYSFYNDIAPLPTDQSKVIRPYSFMPKKPLCQSFVKNALVYSNGYEGFPTVDINTSVSVEYSDLFIDSGVDNEFNEPYFNFATGQADYVSSHEDLVDVNGNPTFLSNKDDPSRFNVHTITIGSDVKTGNTFKLILTNGGGDYYNFTYTAINTDSYLTIANKVKQFLIGTGRIYRQTEEIPSTNIYNNTITPTTITFSYIIRATRDKGYIGGSASVQPVQFNTLKDTGQSVRNIKLGSSIKLGIEYEDFDGRKSLIYTVDALIVNIDTINELGGYKISTITLQINHKPPIWAKYYQIVRSADLVYGSYIQMLIQKVVDVNEDDAQDFLDLVVGSLYTYQKIHPNSPLQYTFEKGDRLRLLKNIDTQTYYDVFETEIVAYNATLNEEITSNVATDGTATVTVGEAKVSNVGKFIIIDGNEREIIDAPTGTTYLLNNTIGSSTAATYLSYSLIDRRGTVRIRKPADITIANNSMVEIYKPSSISNPLSSQQFFEFQKKFAILDAGTENALHAANKQNQTASLPALVEISEGTAYVRNREQPLNNAFPGTQIAIEAIEDQSYSDFYVSLLNDNGRVNAEDQGYGEIHFGSRMRFSNNFIEDTRINGLNDFDNTDREDYNDQYGDIMLTKFDRNLIFTFKQLKTAYVPVDSIITQDNTGLALNVNSAKLLNPIQYFSWEGGIGSNPESYASNGTHKYFVSANSGVIIRLGGNGEEPISKTYGLDNEIKQLLLDAVNNKAKIFGGFDRKNGVYVITIEGYNKYVYFDGFNGWIINDDLLPNDTLFEIVTAPVHGTATFINGFEINYQPTLNYIGSDSFTYRALIGGVWSSAKKACLTIVDIPQDKLWRQKESSFYCVLGEDGIRTGYKGWTTLEEYLIYDGSATGTEKPNVITDPNYVAPVYDLTTCNLPFYNVEKTQNFTRNNCGVDETGSSVPYTVAAGEYYSYVSQADADAMAQADIDANGQNYANANGICNLNPSVPIVLTTIYDADPTVWNGLLFLKNGVETDRIEFETGTPITLGTTYRVGDTIDIIQFHYTTVFPWPPSSNANLNIKKNNVTVLFDGNVADPDIVELQRLTYTIPSDATSVDVVSTGSSTAEGYETKALTSINNLSTNGTVEYKLYDLTTTDFILDIQPNIGTGQYPYNYLINSDDLSLDVINNSPDIIDYIITGELSYSASGTLNPGAMANHNDIPKGSITIQVDVSSDEPPPTPPETLSSPIAAARGNGSLPGSTVQQVSIERARGVKSMGIGTSLYYFSGLLGNGTILYHDPEMTNTPNCGNYYIPASDQVFIIHASDCTNTNPGFSGPPGAVKEYQDY